MSAPIFSQYELVLPRASTTIMKAKCKHCSAVISGRVSTSSNFITHVRRKHREVYNQFIKPNTRPGRTKQNTPPIQESRITPVSVYAQPTDTLIELIAGELLPISIVESPYFREFVSTLDPHYQLPSKEIVSTKLLPEIAASVQTMLKLNLQQAHSVCLSLSLTTHEARTLVGITAHCIIDWEVYSMLLSYSRLDCVCTEDILRQEYEQIVACYDIAHKVISVAVYNSMNINAPFELSLPGLYTDPSDNCIVIRLESVATDTKPLQSISFEFLPKRSPCFVHSLQMVVRDSLNEMSEPLKNSIHKMSTLIQYLRASKHSVVADNDNDLHLTKWMSQLDMIRNLLCLSDEDFNKLEISPLTKEDRDLSLELCAILYPIEHALGLLQLHKNESAGFIIPVTRGIKHKLEQVKVVYNVNMLSAMKTLVRERLSRYEEDDTYITASILDPRFKLRWSNQEERYKIKSALLSKVSFLLSCYAPLSSDSSEKSLKMEDDFFSFMTPTNSKESQLTTLEAETEVIKYLSEPCLEMEANPLQFWSVQQPNFPLLAEMASSYLAMPITSSQNQNVLKKLLKYDHSSLDYETFQMSMIVKFNPNLQTLSNK